MKIKFTPQQIQSSSKRYQEKDLSLSNKVVDSMERHFSKFIGLNIQRDNLSLKMSLNGLEFRLAYYPSLATRIERDESYLFQLPRWFILVRNSPEREDRETHIGYLKLDPNRDVLKLKLLPDEGWSDIEQIDEDCDTSWSNFNQIIAAIISATYESFGSEMLN